MLFFVFWDLPCRDKASFALTVVNENQDIVAHAVFVDHPIGDLVDQAQWEQFLHKHFSSPQCTVCVTYLIISLNINVLKKTNYVVVLS